MKPRVSGHKTGQPLRGFNAPRLSKAGVAGDRFDFGTDGRSKIRSVSENAAVFRTCRMLS